MVRYPPLPKFAFARRTLTGGIGLMNFGKYPYKDVVGYNLDNQALVFETQLPKSPSPS